MADRNYSTPQNERDQQELVLRTMFRAPACEGCGDTGLPLADNGLCGYCDAVEANYDEFGQPGRFEPDGPDAEDFAPCGNQEGK